MIVAAFDIGYKNFAFCIRDSKTLLLENISLMKPDDDFIDILLNLIEEMDKRRDWWDKTDVFLIEKQMGFRGKYNVKALKIAQHLMSYLLIRYGKTKEIIDYPAFHKTKVFDAPKMTKPQRKKWAVEKVLELTNDDEPELYDRLNKRGKRDDMCDCYLHIVSFVILRESGKI